MRVRYWVRLVMDPGEVGYLVKLGIWLGWVLGEVGYLVRLDTW